MIATVVVAVVAVIVIIALLVVVSRSRRELASSQATLNAARTEVAGVRGELDRLQGSGEGLRVLRESSETPAASFPLVAAAASPAALSADGPSAQLATPGAPAASPISTPAAATADAFSEDGPVADGFGPDGGVSPADGPGPAPTGAAEPPATPTFDALWALTRIRQEWASRQAAILGLDDEPPADTWARATLAEVLEEEVARIREETGTPGTLRTSLPAEPGPGQAVLLLSGLQALLDALARHCQGYDLYVHEWEGRLTAIVVCDAFDGPDRVAEDTASVLSAIAPAGGELALDRDARGRLRARLSLATTPA